jgi:hypothetical protein
VLPLKYLAGLACCLVVGWFSPSASAFGLVTPSRDAVLLEEFVQRCRPDENAEVDIIIWRLTEAMVANTVLLHPSCPLSFWFAAAWLQPTANRRGVRRRSACCRLKRENVMADFEWRGETLVWGQGPKVLEVFLEPTCPYSARAFGKLDQLLAEAGEDRLTIKIRLHSQPWHMFSPVLVRAIVAATTLPRGKDAAKLVLTAIFGRIKEFEFDHHATGPNRDASPNDLIRRIEGYTGLELMAAFDNVSLDKAIRWEARYARQNGIHVSPSFMIDGLFQPDMSSGDEVSAWLKKLG